VVLLLPYCYAVSALFWKEAAIVRTILLAVAFLACAATPLCAFTVDADISDWMAADAQCFGRIVTTGSGVFQIKSYGAQVVGGDTGTLYAFVELWNPIGLPDVAGHGHDPIGNSYPAVYIDVDNVAATSIGNLPGAVPQGVDINVEVDFDTATIPDGGGSGGAAVNLWGHNNDWGKAVATTSAVIAHSADQKIFEWSVPVSQIISEVAHTDGATPIPVVNPNTWRMYVGGETSLGGYGREIGLVPEPGTVAMLIAAGLSLAALAWHRRS
jgi:hypothetical protein